MERHNRNNKDAKTEDILKELDDLQGLLDKSSRTAEQTREVPPVAASAVGPFDDIPLLIPESDHDSSVRVQTPVVSGHIPAETGQQELALGEIGTRKDSATRENPFLTHQTRAKLAHNRRQLQQDITDCSRQMSPPPQIDTPLRGSPETTSQAVDPAGKHIDILVDQIVAEWLPRIEKDLKRKLRTILAQQ